MITFTFNFDNRFAFLHHFRLVHLIFLYENKDSISASHNAQNNYSGISL